MCIRDRALYDLSLEIRRGEFVGLIGPTGAGKTTLCLALSGIVPQFYGGRFFGRALVAGMDTVEQPVSALAARVGMVFEDPETQLTATSVENEVAFALENLRTPRPLMRERIARALGAVGLAGLAKRHPHELSGGQRQRIAIARAILKSPSILLLDEPTANLDIRHQVEVLEILKELARKGITIVIALHDINIAVRYASRIMMLKEGKVFASGGKEIINEQNIENLYDIKVKIFREDSRIFIIPEGI